MKAQLIRDKEHQAERPFAVIKTVFKAAHVLVTTVRRVHVKMVFTAFAYKAFMNLDSHPKL